jgi:hypothetical protein
MNSCQFQSCTSLVIQRAQLRKRNRFDALRKLAAFQFEAARLSGLVEASNYEPELSLPSSLEASELQQVSEPFRRDDEQVPRKKSSLSSTQLCLQYSSSLIIHQVQLCKFGSLGAVRKAVAFQLEAVRLNGLVDAFNYEPDFSSSSSLEAYVIRPLFESCRLEKKSQRKTSTLSIKLLLFLLFNLLQLCFTDNKNGIRLMCPSSPQMRDLDLKLPSPRMNLLGYEKTRYSLMPSYNCLDEPKPPLLMLPPKPNRYKSFLVALNRAIAKSYDRILSLF